MLKKLFCLITLIVVVGPSSISFGVSLKVDVGVCGPVQDGWIPLRGARGKLNKNVGGTNIDVIIATGNAQAGECRCDSGSKHALAAVETTYIKMDGNAGSPKSDIIFTLRDFEPGAEYTLYTYHHRWGEDEGPITNVIVTGATHVTKPHFIAQTAHIMDKPAKFVFTAGDGDVVIRYQCLDKGQPFFNGFRLYGGSATVQFGSASSGAAETVSSAKIPVTINDAQADETYTVDYAVTSGSAKSGNDFKLASGKLTFGPGSTTEHISLDIIDDDVHEENETIVVELSNVKGPKVALGTPTKHTYTIIDPRPNVLFARASGSAMEKDTPAYVPVTLSAPTRKKVTVDYAVVGGTATGGGVDYTLNSDTVVFAPGETNQTIPITIVADKNDREPIETIMIKLSNPTNALPGKHTVYTHTIVSQPIDLQVDLAVPTCDGKGIYEGVAKPGWTIWADKSWKDMYMHDGVWLPSRKDPEAFAAGIEGTGVKAFLSTGSEGQLGIGAKGVCRANLGGGGCPKGKASGDPIANSWAYAVDWAGPYAGDIILLLKDLPAGSYELYSYHNHWEPCKQKNRNCLDCICGMPPMPSITANPLPAKPDKTPQDLADNILKRYRWKLPLGTGKGVTAIENAYNVAPQHVLSDEELIPSVIKFATDGSEVLVIYQADRTEPLYPDCARKGREGARGILNAFRLVSLDLEPSESVHSDADLLWKADYFPGFADKNTVALWLLDETQYAYNTLTDAGIYEYDLRLFDADLVRGKFGTSLKTSPGPDFNLYLAEWVGKITQAQMRQPDGKSSGLWGPTLVPEKLVEALANQDWTIEFWVKCLSRPKGKAMILDMGQAYEDGLTLVLDTEAAYFHILMVEFFYPLVECFPWTPVSTCYC